MSDFLKKIRAITEERVAHEKAIRPLIPASSRTHHSFTAALSSGTKPRIIAEVKRASPSLGAIAMNLDPVAVAFEYFSQGAAVISVLTEPTHFGGSLETLANIRRALPQSTLLMKDFVIDEYQLLQAREAGADAVLLMISLLSADEFEKLFHSAMTLGLTPLVEVHDEEEMKIALAVKAPVIGVNNRDLRTLQTSLDVSRRLSKMKSEATLFVSESGIETRDEIAELGALGYDAFLIGSSLMKNQRPGQALHALLQRRLDVKICGITRVEDAVLAVKLGATMVGLVFAEKSLRRVDISRALEITRALPESVRAIGVFTSEDNIRETVKAVGLQGVQFHGFEPSSALVAEMRDKILIRAFEVTENSLANEMNSSVCEIILLDSPRGGERSPLSPDLVKNLHLKRPFIIAGGLTPKNIAAIIGELKPAGIDIASGVEIGVGVKSEEKLRELFRELEGRGV